MAGYLKYFSKRKDGAKSGLQEFQPWYNTDLFFRSTLGFVFILVTLLLFPRAESYKFGDLKEGNISSEEIIAPYTFYVEKNPDELNAEREGARQRILPVFHRNDSTMIELSQLLATFRDSLLQIMILSVDDSSRQAGIDNLIRENRIILTRERIPFFYRLTRIDSSDVLLETISSDYGKYFDQLGSILTDLLVIGIVDLEKGAIPNFRDKIAVLRNGAEEEKPANAFYDMPEARERLLNRLRSQFEENRDSVNVGYALLENLLKPNQHYDEEETKGRISEAIAQVPLVKGMIVKDERIIHSHERVTAQHVDILRSLAQAIREKEAQSGLLSQLVIWLGKFLLIISTQIPLMLFLYFYRPQIWCDRRIMFIIASSVLFVVVLAAVVMHYELPKFLIPFATAPLIITSYQETRTGFFVALTISLLLGAQFGFDYEIALVAMIVSTSSIISFSFSKYRKRLVNATLALILAYLVGITAVAIMRSVSLDNWAVSIGSAAAAAVLAPILAYGFIMLFDTVFDVASEFKLTELSDLNNPLLKTISLRAPGSYHHSLQVSNLSEAAAEAIGANALLAKVGAYYHDIGKIFMPDYFVENQRGGKNPHDRISPRLSSLILINHVRKGYEFAREKKLPTVICNFIVEHHGQSLMKFFYEKAKEDAKDKDIDIPESDFRYPGNRPTTKETGILMLADTVEAMVRSFKEPNLGKIRNAIRNSVEEKIHGGELDNCPLTVNDLRIIVETFSNILMGMHHERVEYPDQEKLFQNSSKVLAT